VRPHLEYGNVIWYPHLKRQSIAVERVQRRAIKLIKECRNMSYSERLKYLNLHSLKGRRVRGDLIETYKLYHGLVDIEWDNFFTATPYSHTRNATGKVFLHRSNTNLRKYCFSSRVANHWNNLCSQLKNAQNINMFKNLLDASSKYIELFTAFDE
jgi:transposase